MGASQGKAVLEHARLQVRDSSLPSQLMAWYDPYRDAVRCAASAGSL